MTDSSIIQYITFYVGRMEDRLYPVLSKSGEADMMDAIISSIEHSFNSL